MIRFVRTATIAPGKLGSALAFAREVAEHIKKHHGTTLEILAPVGGNPSRIAWKTDYPNLGALEDMQSKLMSDAAYLQLVEKGGANFVPGSLNDSIWKTI